jgi:hypothetical protein
MKKVKSLSISGLMFIIIMMLPGTFTGCSPEDSTFYDKVLNDFDTNSYYVAIDIRCPSYKGRVLFENNDLYLLLHKTKGLDKEEYKSFMKRILIHHRILKIRSAPSEVLNLIKVAEQASVDVFANEGQNKFIARYFNGRVLNDEVPMIERYAIINQLFFWDIPSKIEKYSGKLIIG